MVPLGPGTAGSLDRQLPETRERHVNTSVQRMKHDSVLTTLVPGWGSTRLPSMHTHQYRVDVEDW